MTLRDLSPLLILSFVAAPCSADDFEINLGRGPVLVEEPQSYDPGVPTPLVVLLHGYGSSGQGQEDYLKFSPLSEEFGFFYMYPDGTVDEGGDRFWNATDACCDFYDTGIDDSAYIRALIDETKSLRNIDDTRVFVVGHSNGGFMSSRLACDHAETIAAIANFAGSSWNDPSLCEPSAPVHSLRIHGTLDTVIRYRGGYIEDAGFYPGAIRSSIHWGRYNDCAPVVDQSAPPMNLDWLVPGAETHIAKAEVGCELGGSVELWEMRRSWHIPLVTSRFSRGIVEYFYAHPKP